MVKRGYRKLKHIHMVGIGGTGMNGIAEVLLNLGYDVSGSDIQENEATQRLAGSAPGSPSATGRKTSARPTSWSSPRRSTTTTSRSGRPGP